MNPWRTFNTEGTVWQDTINVRDFIIHNITQYNGTESFLQQPTENTKTLWEKVLNISNEVLIDETRVGTITSHPPGYINKSLEQIVGLQSDKPLERTIIPQGGIRLVETALKAYNKELPKEIKETFSKHTKTVNEGVFSAYTPEILNARRSGVITGLPDAYGRGRIIGDYRRVALYGLTKLIQDKLSQQRLLYKRHSNDETIRLREEVSEQIIALNDLVELGSSYNVDLTKPASNAKEAIQWLYFGYLGAIKQQNGAAMSLGRTSSFLDIYIERDIQEGILTEIEAQELVDHFIMKLRIVRFLRTPDYDELFSGDPVWITESIGGISDEGKHLVTKTSYRYLHTLYNLGPAPEPNLTVLWSDSLPDAWKKYTTKVAIETSAIQFESDESMRKSFGDDYSIACCVSGMTTGKSMQYFGARCNLAKALLYAINGGRDEITGVQVGPKYEAIQGDYLIYEEVKEKFDVMLDWIAKVYIDALNIIHYMADKYSYESLQMALHDLDVQRTMACGIAGLSVCADSLAAIKYGKIKVIRKEGLIVSYVHEGGEYPVFGNDDARVDSIANDLVKTFVEKLQQRDTYRNARVTQSILTITSNVVYGKKTGDTPCGRLKGEPFAPGANPMHNRDENGALPAILSVAKLPYEFAQDGISYTFSIIPEGLGKDLRERKNNLITLLSTYFSYGGQHINVNCLNREMLVDAMKHSELYPQLTVRVSGYAVNFIKLTKEQQEDIISRTFHK